MIRMTTFDCGSEIQDLERAIWIFLVILSRLSYTRKVGIGAASGGLVANESHAVQYRYIESPRH